MSNASWIESFGRHRYRSFTKRKSVEAKPLTAKVEENLRFSQNVYNLIIELHPTGSYTPDLRNTLFHALADQVIEHLGAIIGLVERRQFFGSAFALLRPLIESYLRSVWVQSVASEEQLIAVAQRQDEFPPFGKCRAAVEKFFTEQGVVGLYALNREFVKALNGFTHSGLEQIAYRLDSSYRISPYQYPEASVISLLDQASRFAVMAAMIVVQAIEGSAAEMSPTVDILQLRFNRLRHVHGLEERNR